MKPSILLLALAVISITSCTSAYKTGQTPDDVYFSPQRSQAEYVVKDRNDDPGYYNGDDYYGDRYLRMKVQNRYQWSDLDDYYYNDRYSYGGFGGYSYYNTGLYMNNPWSPMSYWNYYYNPYYSSYYNPYYSPIFIVGKGNGYGNSYSVTSRPRMFNLNTYNSNQLTNGNYTNRRFDFNSSPVNVNRNNYNNNYRNSRTNAGGFLRNAFGSGNNNSNNSNSNDNSRSYNNNNNNSSSSSSGGRSSGGGGGSSSGGSSAPVRKF